MADGTKIEWTDATWNVVNGCSVTSPGCTNCYAMKLAGTRLKHVPSRAGLTKSVNGNHVWTGKTRFNEPVLLDPLRWTRPRRIFVCAHGDLFHESVPDDWIDNVFAVMVLSPQHTFQVLTKRPERMREYLGRHRWHIWCQIARKIDAIRLDSVPVVIGGDCHPIPNVWLGVSVEDQKRADERIPHLLATPAAVRFLSCEPLLSNLELGCIDPQDGAPSFGADMLDAVKGEGWICDEDGELDRIVPIPHLNWVIAGGESGPGARPMHPNWARSLRDQCAAAGVAFHFKQWGEFGPYNMEPGVAGFWFDPNGSVYQGPTTWPPEPGESRAYMIRWGNKRAGRQLDGVEHNGMPA